MSCLESTSIWLVISREHPGSSTIYLFSTYVIMDVDRGLWLEKWLRRAGILLSYFKFHWHWPVHGNFGASFLFIDWKFHCTNNRWQCVSDLRTWDQGIESSNSLDWLIQILTKQFAKTITMPTIIINYPRLVNEMQQACNMNTSASDEYDRAPILSDIHDIGQ